MNTVNVEFSRGGNFPDIAFFAKISPARKFNPYDFIEEIGVVSWKWKVSATFLRIFPQRK